MILYLDTSALVKLYVEEEGSEEVRQWAAEAEIVATGRVAFAEAVSAFTRRCNRGDMSEESRRLLLEALRKDWDSFAVTDFDALQAGDLAAAYGIRGFDAVHLSSAKILASSPGAPAVVFASYDEKLNEAARGEGIGVVGV